MSNLRQQTYLGCRGPLVFSSLIVSFSSSAESHMEARKMWAEPSHCKVCVTQKGNAMGLDSGVEGGTPGGVPQG
jgi:hypothetical protein